MTTAQIIQPAGFLTDVVPLAADPKTEQPLNVLLGARAALGAAVDCSAILIVCAGNKE
jgi:hypothetical protein